MSISRQNLTIIIVTFKSEKVIHNCIKSIGQDIKILIVDNAQDEEFKEIMEKKYKNVSCIVSEKNLGMGAGNNLGIKNIKSDFAFIINPDVVLEPDTIDVLIDEINKLGEFSIVAPIEVNKDYPNYKLDKKTKSIINEIDPFQVKSVDGYAMLLNIKRINLVNQSNYFDENFFMYLENDDLCKRLIKKDEKIFVIPKSKIKHLGGKAVDINFKHEVELSRNWHWIWSKFYFNKKYNGYLSALIYGIPNFVSSLLKFSFYLITNNNFKKKIYQMRVLGFLNALLNKPSSHRPKIDN